MGPFGKPGISLLRGRQLLFLSMHGPKMLGKERNLHFFGGEGGGNISGFLFKGWLSEGFGLYLKISPRVMDSMGM